MGNKIKGYIQYFTTQFEDKAKPDMTTLADTLLKPVMWLAGGRTIRYMANIHGGKTFSAPQEKEVEGKLSKLMDVTQKIAAVGLVILGAAIFIPALMIKATNQTNIDLHKSFKKAGQAGDTGKDRVSYQEKIAFSF